MKFIMWTVVYIILLGAFTARADNLRRIVVFLDGTPLPVQQTVVQLVGVGCCMSSR